MSALKKLLANQLKVSQESEAVEEPVAPSTVDPVVEPVAEPVPPVEPVTEPAVVEPVAEPVAPVEPVVDPTAPVEPAPVAVDPAAPVEPVAEPAPVLGITDGIPDVDPATGMVPGTAPVVAAPEPAPIEDIDAANIASKLEEINAGNAEYASSERDQEQLDDAAASLESLAIALENELTNGGLSPQAAGIANIALESILRPLGIEPRMLSTECYGQQSDRITSTQIALEGVKEMAGKVAEVGKTVVAKIIEIALAMFKKVMAALGNVSAKADSLAGKVATAEFTTDYVDIGPAAEKLAINGAVNNPIANMNVVSDIAGYVFGDYLKEAETAVKSFLTGGEPKLPTFIKATVKSDDGIDTPAMLGDKVIRAQVNTDGDAVDQLKGFRVRLVDRGVEFKGTTKVKPLNKAQADQVIEGVKGILSQLDGAKPLVATLEDLAKRVKDAGAGPQIINKIRHAEEEPSAQDAKAVVTSLCNMATQPMVGFSAYMMALCAAWLKLVDASMAGAPEKAPAGDAPALPAPTQA